MGGLSVSVATPSVIEQSKQLKLAPAFLRRESTDDSC